jgi:hypothetical protein
MHNLEIKDRKVYLDGIQIEDVSSYELKSSAEHPTAELTLKLWVKDSNILLNNRKPEIIGWREEKKELLNVYLKTQSGDLVCK